MEIIIEKFFKIGEIVIMDHNVMYRGGKMFGKVQLIPTKENIFCKNDGSYAGIYDSEWAGITDMHIKYFEFSMYTGVGPLELYQYIVKKYEQQERTYTKS